MRVRLRAPKDSARTTRSPPFTFAPEHAPRQIHDMSKVNNPPDRASSIRSDTSAADPAARQPKWSWLIGLLVAATASLGFRVVSGMFLVSPQSDQYIAGYAFRDFAAQSLRSGNGFPQWNPFMFGGLPYVAAMHGDIFYPTFLLRLLMRTDLAMTWGFIIHLLLAGVFTVGFVRALGLSRWAATFAGLAYMMSGPIASYASPGHDGKLFVSALLPLSLWMLMRAIRDGRMYAWGVFAFAVGLGVLSPHPQLLQYSLLTTGAFALFLVWRGPHGAANAPASLDVRFAITRLGGALVMVVLGLAIGAIQYWPVLGYVSESPRASGRECEFAASYSLPPEELFNTYLPQFSGMLNQYWGRNAIHLHSEYLGIVVLMLVPLAFGAGARKALARFWLVTAGVALLWALGGFTPFFRIVYAIVPGTRFFRAPSTIIYVLTFALCLLSALGFERVLARHFDARFIRRYVIGWMMFASIVAVLSLSGALTVVAQNIGRDVARDFGHDPAGFAAFIQGNQKALTLGSLRSFAVALIACGLLWSFTVRKLGTTRFAVLALLLCGADLWSIAHNYWRFSQPASGLFAGDPIINYLKEQQQPGRVFVYTKTADYRVASDPYFGSRGFGEGAGFMAHGIRTVTGYHGNEIARYDDLMSNGALINPGFWQHENVRWLYTNMVVADSVLRKINGPTPNSAGSTTYLYEIPGDNGYAWVAASFGARDDAAAAREVLRADYNPHVFVSVAPATIVAGKSVNVAPALMPEPSTIHTTVTDFAPGRATVQLNMPATEGSALVISENYYKGWRAVADGQALPVMRTSYNLVGVPLPVGARTVTFSFHDDRYDAGRLVTLIALTLTTLLTLFGWRYSLKR
ncbi:MAG: hypothetical protein ABJB74_06215 [Gemmatimonas sp.]